MNTKQKDINAVLFIMASYYNFHPYYIHLLIYHIIWALSSINLSNVGPLFNNITKWSYPKLHYCAVFLEYFVNCYIMIGFYLVFPHTSQL